MSLAVHEALKLEVTEGFRLVAGLGGLDRKISRVGLIDSEEHDQIVETVMLGEFLVTNLLIIRDQPELIVEYIKGMVESQAACLAIKSTYFKDIPKDAIDYADKHQFPVFIFDDTYIDLLMIEINEALTNDGYEQRISHMVDQIINTHLNEFRIREIAKELNRNFKDNYIVYYIKENIKLFDEKSDFFSHISIRKFLGESGLSLKYKDGYLVIASYDSIGKIIESIESLLKVSGLIEEHYIIGISELKSDLGQLGRAIHESLYAYDYAVINEKNKISFTKIGVYQLLMPLSNNAWVHSFYKEIINKLSDNDKKHGTDLLNTAIRYILNEGDIQTSSKDLFQHSNTIRYRIKKIANLMDSEHMKGMTYEKLALAIRLYLINYR